MLLRVQPQTIRRRLRAGTLEAKRGDGVDVVVLDPHVTFFYVEDVGAALGVTAGTVRQMLGRGDLAGVRQHGGRWRVRLQSVLEHSRCDPELVVRFGGEAPAPEPARLEERPARLVRPVYARLDVETAELLDRAVDRHGTQAAALAAALRALDDDVAPGELAELRVELELLREQEATARDRAAAIVELARRHHVDELYCPRCERLVPIDEADYVIDDEGHVAMFHAEHGYHAGGRIRASTIMARRHEADAAA